MPSRQCLVFGARNYVISHGLAQEVVHAVEEVQSERQCSELVGWSVREECSHTFVASGLIDVNADHVFVARRSGGGT